MLDTFFWGMELDMFDNNMIYIYIIIYMYVCFLICLILISVFFWVTSCGRSQFSQARQGDPGATRFFLSPAPRDRRDVGCWDVFPMVFSGKP